MLFQKFSNGAQKQPQRSQEEAHSGAQQAQGRDKAVPPEVPQRPQQGAEQHKKQHAASQYADDHIDPQLPVAKGQRKIEQGRQHHCGIQAVQQAADPPARPRQAHSPQQVIEQAQQQTQQDGGQEGAQLLGDLDLHQPKRRPKRRPLP